MKRVNVMEYEERKISEFLDEFEKCDITILVPRGIKYEEEYNTYTSCIVILYSEMEKLREQKLTERMFKAFQQQTKIRCLLLYADGNEMMMSF